ncbi:MAG: hypothetical protein U1F77_11825 [Kiritimatiellia bacterium]
MLTEPAASYRSPRSRTGSGGSAAGDPGRPPDRQSSWTTSRKPAFTTRGNLPRPGPPRRRSPSRPRPARLIRLGEEEDPTLDAPALAFTDPWKEDIRARRFRNLLLLLVTVGVSAAITFFAVRYYEAGRTGDPNLAARPAAPAPP